MIKEVTAKELIYAIESNSYGIADFVKEKYGIKEINLDNSVSAVRQLDNDEINPNQIYNEFLRERMLNRKNERQSEEFVTFNPYGASKFVKELFAIRVVDRPVSNFESASSSKERAITVDELIEGRGASIGMLDFIHNPSNIAKILFVAYDKNEDMVLRGQAMELIAALSHMGYDFSVVRSILVDVATMTDEPQRDICYRVAQVLEHYIENSNEKAIEEMMGTEPQKVNGLLHKHNLTIQDIQTYMTANNKYLKFKDLLDKIINKESEASINSEGM